MERVVLYGAGGHSRVVIDCLQDAGKEVVGIFDDDDGLVSLNGFDVIGNYDKEEFSDCKMVISIGVNLIRRKIVHRTSHAYTIAQHPTAIVSKYAKIGEGTVLMQCSILQSGSFVGKHCILNTACSVDHDSLLADYVHISPGVILCANVTIGKGTHVGAGATILPGVKVGEWCEIGAGAVITKDIPDRSVVIGIPGKVIRSVDLV